ncbi:hypothetical protein HK104_005498, partial [Borealophlyctis nickersoniae]
MDWLKKTAVRFSPARSTSATSLPALNTSADDNACCSLAYPWHRGSFGDDPDGTRLLSLWTAYEKSRERVAEFDGRGLVVALDEDQERSGSFIKRALDALAEEERLKEESFEALRDYLVAFNTRFGELSSVFEDSDLSTVFPLSAVQIVPIPVEAPSGGQTSSSSDDSSAINFSISNPVTPPFGAAGISPPTPLGHPHHTVVGTIDALQDLTESFAEKFTAPTPSPSVSADAILRRTFIALKHTEILARYDGNRDALIRHGALNHLVTILKAGCSALRASRGAVEGHGSNHAGEGTKPVAESPPYNVEMLENVLLCSTLVLQRCADPDGVWEHYIRTGWDRPNSNTAGGAQQPRDGRKLLGARTLGLFTQCLVALLEILQELETCTPRRERYMLQSQCLNALGCLAACNPPAVIERLLLLESVPAVCRVLGWPAFLTVIADGGDDPWAGTCESTLRSEFKCQMLGWNLVHLLSSSSTDAKRELERLGAFERVAELFEWTAWVVGGLGTALFGSEGVGG